MEGWQRTFRVVFAANLITGIGMMSFLPFFPSLVAELGVEDERLRATWAGVLFGAAPLAAAVMAPVWGTFGDRHGRKPMVVRSMLAITVFVGAMGFARSPWQLLALRIGQGIFSGFIAPSLTLVSVAAPAGRQGRITGALQTATSVGSIAVLAEEDPRLRRSAGAFSLASIFGSAAQDLAALAANPRLRRAVVLFTCVQFALGATNPSLELFVEDLWRGSPERAGSLTATLFSVLALAFIAATPVWGRLGDRAGHGRALRLSTLFSAATLALHALAPSYVWLLLARIAFGVSSPGASAGAFGIAATDTPAERRGSAMGAVFSARALAASLGALAGGALVPVLGIRGLFACSGAGIALALLALRHE
jgi:DHA1 family multidrug resistance protein-like MFS transporter